LPRPDRIRSHWWLSLFKQARERDRRRERRRDHNQGVAASKEKHIKAIQSAVDTILERNPRLSARRVFDEIPITLGDRGIKVQINGVAFSIYRDDDQVVAYNCSTKRERVLERKTSDRPWRVLERYVKRHRTSRPPHQLG
jgi:hypothetical protein